MKAYRIIIVVLLLLVGWLAYVAVSSREKPGTPQPEELWHTNTVEVWHTNSIDVWHTNTVAAPQPNPTTQTVTNEVVREVPAKLTPTEIQAADLGYKYIHAPTIENRAEALYQASPLAVEVDVAPNTAAVLNQDASAFRKTVESILNSHGIQVAAQSQYHLVLRVNTLWRTDVPRVELVGYRLDLRQTVTAQRQDDLLKLPATIWSAATAKLVNLGYMPDDAQAVLQDLLDKFVADYQKTQAAQQSLGSRLPTIPSDFLQGEK